MLIKWSFEYLFCKIYLYQSYWIRCIHEALFLLNLHPCMLHSTICSFSLRYILPTNYCKLLHITYSVCVMCVACVTHASRVRRVRHARVAGASHARVRYVCASRRPTSPTLHCTPDWHATGHSENTSNITWWQYICLLCHPPGTTIHLSYRASNNIPYPSTKHPHPPLIPTHLTTPPIPHTPPT